MAPTTSRQHTAYRNQPPTTPSRPPTTSPTTHSKPATDQGHAPSHPPAAPTKGPGRPRNPKPRLRDQGLAIRVTQQEKEDLLKAARDHNLSLTDFIVSLTKEG